MKKKLIKDKSIFDLLEHLEAKFGEDSFIIEDNWEADLCAIGLTNPKNNYLLYISTFSQKALHYNIVIEIKVKSGDLPYASPQTFENYTISELEIFFQKYFKSRIE